MATSQANGTGCPVTSYFQYMFIDNGDKRTNDWPLIRSPVPLLSILVVYWLLVLKWGPSFMKNRKPYKLRKTLMVYNILQVIANTYLFYRGFLMWKDYNWNCQPLDRSFSESAMFEAVSCYLYFLNKISDLLDTIFFVLRKKDNQITFLHLFHHSIMPVCVWFVVKYFPGGHATFVGFVNSFVHIILYAYYFLAAFGPEVQKYLWWKRYITKIQLIQFIAVFIHSLQLFFINCDYPKSTVFIILPNSVIFFYLFSDFYRKAYVNIQRRLSRAVVDHSVQNGHNKKKN